MRAVKHRSRDGATDLAPVGSAEAGPEGFRRSALRVERVAGQRRRGAHRAGQIVLGDSRPSLPGNLPNICYRRLVPQSITR